MNSGVMTLVTEAKQALQEQSPGPGDASARDVWEQHTVLMEECGTRLLEPRFGNLLDAADEVLAFLFHYEKVKRVMSASDLTVPETLRVNLNVTGRYLGKTDDRDEIVLFLKHAPTFASDLGEYAARQQGLRARNLRDSLALLARAGGAYREFLDRTIPH